jgi:ABC-type enterochelin transport system permease subunit
MQSERVVVAIISTTVTTVVAPSIVVAFVAIVVVAVGAFGSPFLGLLIPIIIISTAGRPRARATIVRVVAIPIILRLW